MLVVVVCVSLVFADAELPVSCVFLDVVVFLGLEFGVFLLVFSVGLDLWIDIA